MNSTVADLLENCARIGTSTWSDALDDFAIDGVVRGMTRRSGGERFAAIAVTAKQRAGTRGDFEKAELGAGPMLEALGPDRVLMVDLSGAEISTFGGLAAFAAKQSGAAAVVVDGTCRDLEDIRATDVWVATRHVTPTTGKMRVTLEGMDVPVTIGGIKVNSGDLVIGDDTGIVVVPKNDIVRVLRVAEKKLSQDLEVEKELHAGKSFADAAKTAKYM